MKFGTLLVLIGVIALAIDSIQHTYPRNTDVAIRIYWDKGDGKPQEYRYILGTNDDQTLYLHRNNGWKNVKEEKFYADRLKGELFDFGP